MSCPIYPQEKCHQDPFNSKLVAPQHLLKLWKREKSLFPLGSNHDSLIVKPVVLLYQATSSCLLYTI
jgi:hypothetical protein